MKWLDLMGERWFQRNKSRAVSMLVFIGLMCCGSIYSIYGLPSNSEWIGWLAFSGSMVFMVVAIKVFKNIEFNEDSSTKSFHFEDLLLTILMFALFSFNIIM